MKKYRILVFPCGSEIGLEIHRSLRFSAHVELIGASSVNDHGKFVYDNYSGNFPNIDSDEIIQYLSKVVINQKIDAIYPTMDKVVCILKNYEAQLGCRIISSPKETTDVCLSKKLTYGRLKNIVKVPEYYGCINDISEYPVFVKPDIGYGSRDTYKADNFENLQYFFSKHPISDYVISEYLIGEEYTVDCFTDRFRKLRFSGPRVRKRISNGISVNTVTVNQNAGFFSTIAEKINDELEMRGAWFFQVKRDNYGVLTLLEVAARLGGSSSMYRGKGINFALLSIYDAFDINIELMENSYDIELDRALDNKYKIDLQFDTIYVDFDDCLIINNQVNVSLVSFLFNCINRGKRVILITKHENEIFASLAKYRLNSLFDEIIQIPKTANKTEYITCPDSIFIDDSFQERKNVSLINKIPVFSPDMVECLN